LTESAITLSRKIFNSGCARNPFVGRTPLDPLRDLTALPENPAGSLSCLKTYRYGDSQKRSGGLAVGFRADQGSAGMAYRPTSSPGLTLVFSPYPCRIRQPAGSAIGYTPTKLRKRDDGKGMDDER